MPSSSPRAVRIPDANLRYWLARDLNGSEGEALTDADLAAVTRLRTHDPRAAVADLTGLEYATGLTELRIRLDGLPDLGPLASLTSLTVLDLGGWPNGRLADISVLPLERMTGLTELVLDYHEIADIAPLACLEKLTVLDLSSNEITDLRPLAELTGLTKLSLYGNPVRDVSPLAGLKNLKELNLVHNKVSDLAPLLSDGDSVFHLSGNPLSAESLDQHVPALRARGVRVACSAIRFARRSSSASLRPPLPYAPDRNERELIARLMDMTRRNGYRPAALPSVLVSFEPPPLMVAYPELEDELEEGDREPVYWREGNRGRPETTSIEELLGMYEPEKQLITLWETGIEWFGRRFRVNCDTLFAVVLVHEFGHWITHQLPKPGVPTWPTDLYVLGERDMHEGWAQLMTFWIAREIGRQAGPGGDFRRTFEELNDHQSSPYHTYKQFESEPVDRVIASLEKMRRLSEPARLQDWKQAIADS